MSCGRGIPPTRGPGVLGGEYRTSEAEMPEAAVRGVLCEQGSCDSSATHEMRTELNVTLTEPQFMAPSTVADDCSPTKGVPREALGGCDDEQVR